MTLTVKTTGIDQALFSARVLGKEAPMAVANLKQTGLSSRLEKRK
jgi:hypothetical protein